MNLSDLIRFNRVFVLLVVLLSETGVGLYQKSSESSVFITWNDLIVRQHSLESTDSDGALILVVNQNGGGDSTTVQGAVDLVPENNSQRVKICILPGIYREKVFVPRSKPYISFIGDKNKASETVITWHDKASDQDRSGHFIGTWNSASVAVESDYFCASWITFENTVVSAGVNGHQAVALRISGDRAMFYKVRILGSQDTLLDDIGYHFFYKCFIQGTIDFIFGSAKSLYRECNINVVGVGFAIAAQHRSSPSEDSGFSFVSCKVHGTGFIFLGRAWGRYATIVYSNCEIDAEIRPEGWEDWSDRTRDRSVMFGEYGCTGKGADRRGRVAWSKSLDYEEAEPFLESKFIRGNEWLKL